MFLGEFEHTLDGKGRVILPAKFRDRLAGGIVLTVGDRRCIDVFPRAEFEREAARLQQEVIEGRKPESRIQLFTARAYEEVPDGQGRVTIPVRLREYAQLDRELSVNGRLGKIQIWDRATWAAHGAAAEEAWAEVDDGADGTGA